MRFLKSGLPRNVFGGFADLCFPFRRCSRKFARCTPLVRGLMQVGAHGCRKKEQVLCPSCHGENDNIFQHCQYCGRERKCVRQARRREMELALAAKASMRRRETVAALFRRFNSLRRTYLARSTVYGSRASPWRRLFKTRDVSGFLDSRCNFIFGYRDYLLIFRHRD